MIRSIKVLGHIGTFDWDIAAASLDLKQLSLIYADNARGKTTVAAVLRSLASGDAQPILERQRLGSDQPPQIVLDCEATSSKTVFENGSWNRIIPNLKVFDDVFVDENIYSGLDVEPHHRQHLHEFILGDQGVALNRRLQTLVSRIAEHNTALNDKRDAIPKENLGSLSVDQFCALTQRPDVDDQIDTVERELKAARDQGLVQTTSLFQTVGLPLFDVDGIRQILSKDLQDLDSAAESQVQAHLENLGTEGESWIANGMEHLVQGDQGVCPFCGQDVSGLDLVAHYRTYFSDGYAQLKRDVAQMIENIERDHAEGTQVAFERAVGIARQTAQFWTTYCDVPPIEIDTEVVAQSWVAARETVTDLLKMKQLGPLEQHILNDQDLTVLSEFNTQSQYIKAISDTLISSNEAINGVKEQAKKANVEDLQTKLTELKAAKARFSDELAPLCAAYVQELKDKANTEDERAKAREELEGYRTNVFPTLQKGVNDYLERFNAGFRIDSFTYSNIGGGAGSTCTYNVVINEHSVAVRNSKSQLGEPSFRNTLSSGDRNTLALALFLSTLDQNPNLDSTIVVIDDPISSMDDHRSLATVQEVRKLAARAKQAIALSHSKRFLCDIWRGANQKECATLEIAQSGDESTIRAWDVTLDAATEHDQRYALLEAYATSQSGNKREVASAIRPHLESYLRVACPGAFPPRKLLGEFITECSQRLGESGEILTIKMLQELNEIVEYSNPYHHATEEAWASEEINATQLRGFVNKTLAFVGPSKA